MAFRPGSRPPLPPPVAPKRSPLSDSITKGSMSPSPSPSAKSKRMFGTAMASGIDHMHRRHDVELELMENFRVIVHKRARAEQHYAQELVKIQQATKKAPLKDAYEDYSIATTYDAWNKLMDGIEVVDAKVSENAAKMSSVLLKRIDQLIRDKRSARKAFDTTRLRLDQENNYSSVEVQKARRRYQECKHSAEEAKLKFEQSKPKQLENNKKAYHKKAEQLFTAHNEYIAAIGYANQHERSSKVTLTPLCLDIFQERMEIMMTEWGELLSMFSSCLNLHEEMAANYGPADEMLSQVNAVEEYQQFIEHRQDRTSSPVDVHQFDPHIMEYCRIPLGEPGQIVINDVSVVDLQKKVEKSQKSLEDLERNIAERTGEYEAAKAEQAEKPGTLALDGRPRHVLVSILKEQVEDINAKYCRQKCVYDIFKGALEEAGDNVPGAFTDNHPPLPPLPDEPPPTTSPSREYDEGTSSTSATSKGRTSTWGKNFGKLVSGRKKSASETKNTISSDYYDPEQLDHPPPPLPPFRGGSNGDHKAANAPSLDEELWYYSDVNRKDAELLLKRDGDYLIRLSKEKGPVLTMKWQGIAKHFVVQQCEEGYRFEAEFFPSIQELLDYYRENNVPVTRRTPAILSAPVNKAKRLDGKWNICHSDVELGNQLGKGHFGEVWKGTLKTKRNNTPVAIKTCKSDFFPDKHKFLKEAEILQQYDHPNIVKLIGIAADCDPVYIVMELMAGGDFINFLRKQGSTTSTGKMIKFGVDAGSGMEYLAGKNCIHRDLAARNCLIGENNAVLKISDFGMSREEDSGMYEVSSGTKQVPIKWTAPEALNYGKYTSQSDVWSFGILLWETFSCGSVPYPGLSNNEARDRVEEGSRMECPRECPGEVYSIMKECWEYEPDERPSFADLVSKLKKLQKKFK